MQAGDPDYESRPSRLPMKPDMRPSRKPVIVSFCLIALGVGWLLNGVRSQESGISSQRDRIRPLTPDR
jgi:hypothetical protein